jgi:hypothetical protein
LRRGGTQCGLELFAAHGIRLAPAPLLPLVPELEFLSIIGFAGARVGGVLVLGADETILQRCNGTASASSDWIAELGNQFLGRIKNSLLREGIAIHRSPPAVVHAGAQAALYLRPGSESVRLADDRDAIWIWMDWETDFAAEPAATLTPADTDVLTEGEMLLF